MRFVKVNQTEGCGFRMASGQGHRMRPIPKKLSGERVVIVKRLLGHRYLSLRWMERVLGYGHNGSAEDGILLSNR